MTHLPKPCDICGDVGFIEDIATCFRCKIAREHGYCMRVRILSIPEIWFCEPCHSSQSTTSSKSGEQPPKSLTSNTNRVIHLNHPSSGHFRQEVSVGAEAKPMLSEEAMKLSSGTQKMQPSPSIAPGSESDQTDTTVMMYRSHGGLKTAPSKLCKHKVEDTGVRPAADLKSPKRGKRKIRKISSIILQENSAKALKGDNKLTELQFVSAAHQVPDKMTSLVYEDKYFHKEVPNDTLVLSDMPLVPLPAGEAVPISCSGDVIPIDIKPKSLATHKSKLSGELSKLVTQDDVIHPPPDFIWHGSFQIPDSISCSESSDSFHAYLPAKVHRKAFEFSKQMPEVLFCTLLPCASIWPQTSPNNAPTADDIALYFFPGTSERSKEQYAHLLGLIETRDQVLRSCINSVELFIFSSKSLHTDGGRNFESFLWGLFRHVKRKVAVPQLTYNGASKEEKQSSNVNKEANEGLLKVKIEQLNDADTPPGFSRKSAGDAAAMR